MTNATPNFPVAPWLGRLITTMMHSKPNEELHMNKSLATLALAAVPALFFSACNGGAGGGSSAVAPLPNSAEASHASRVRGLDNGPQDLHAGGATFPA